MCTLLRGKGIRKDKEIAEYGLPVADTTCTRARMSMTGLRILEDQKYERLTI